jgi:predicted phosphate transport protein (TIGR00153 family)
MGSKADKFYFNNFLKATECCVEAAKFLDECFNNYDAEKLQENIIKMHEYEHKADEVHHEMSAALAKAFVTPLDREDIAQISANIDEVADTIEEVLQRLYVDEIKEIPEYFKTFSTKIVECCELLKRVLEELPTFKKPKKLKEMILNLGALEEECDKLYLEGTLKIRKENTDVLLVIALRDTLYKMERCADACEHVCDTIEMIVMKNT